MKTEDLRGMSSDQLVELLTETQQNLFRLRMQAQTETLNASTKLQHNRRLIARILTIQNQRARQATAAAVAK